MAENTWTSDDRLLGGRVLLRQPHAGLRAGVDAVLLAAAVPARTGERVLELGCGSGAGFLCLAARVAGLTIVAVEREPALAGLARANAAANACAAEVIEADVRAPGLPARIGRVAHAFANPPWWGAGTPPPALLRRAATHAEDGELADWTRVMAAVLAGRGTATLILPSARFDAGVVALRDAGFGAIVLVPVASRAGEAARRVLLTGRRQARGPATVRPALALHAADGRFTEAAHAILWDGEALA